MLIFQNFVRFNIRQYLASNTMYREKGDCKSLRTLEIMFQLLSMVQT